MVAENHNDRWASRVGQDRINRRYHLVIQKRDLLAIPVVILLEGHRSIRQAIDDRTISTRRGIGPVGGEYERRMRLQRVHKHKLGAGSACHLANAVQLVEQHLPLLMILIEDETPFEGIASQL